MISVAQHWFSKSTQHTAIHVEQLSEVGQSMVRGPHMTLTWTLASPHWSIEPPQHWSIELL